jgi:glutaredoxin 3
MLEVYSKSNCPNCEKAKGMLDIAGLEYTVIKVDEDDSAYQFLIKEGHRAVPQIYSNGTAIVGGVQGLPAFIESIKGTA